MRCWELVIASHLEHEMAALQRHMCICILVGVMLGYIGADKG
jgi:hypothetical protein